MGEDNLKEARIENRNFKGPFWLADAKMAGVSE